MEFYVKIIRSVSQEIHFIYERKKNNENLHQICTQNKQIEQMCNFFQRNLLNLFTLLEKMCKLCANGEKNCANLTIYVQICANLTIYVQICANLTNKKNVFQQI